MAPGSGSVTFGYFGGWGGQQPGGELGAGADLELLEDVPDVRLRGVLRDEHRRDDLPVRLALGLVSAIPWSAVQQRGIV